jgi:hypothetical protein
VQRRAVVVIFVAALALCAAITKPHATSWNDLSRLATIESLASRHTAAIDDSPFSPKTEDKYHFRGRTYSDKPPALALQGAVVATALAPLGIVLARTPERAVYLITLLTVGVWFALGCAYAYAFQRLIGIAPRRAALVAAITGLGTLALPYATVLANHVPSGAAALAGVYHLVRARKRNGALDAALGGLFLALAYAFDASAVVFAVAAVMLLWGAPLRLLLACAAACAPVVAAQFAYNASVSAGWGPPAMNQTTWSDPASPFHRADQSLLHFSGAGDYARYVLYLLLGAKGLVSYTPLALLAAYGLARMWRTPQRRIALAIGAACALYFALMVAFTNDYGALNYGERRYVNLFFVLCAGLGPALEALPAGAAAVAGRIAVAWSMALAMLGTIAPFGEPRGVGGTVFAVQEFERLIHRAPVQAGLDVLVGAVMILLVQRAWSSAAAPTSGTVRRGASRSG